MSGATAYRIAETGQRVNAVELELHFQFGLWTVTERDGDRWVVRTADGEQLTLRPLSD
ncbi:hypothetical protein [Haloarcula onubensis]|uniref:Halobacterial output domain-containing protein n=1 Tax=Haloarcula onubensis TaxID=2950539 RepID=A0ABU2FQC2_9EURY|nr:hypothetical protein [Halomicroarcula sp. S3CR25-11]MDS0282955.1 hypothetical protein [Halomicroarcula sp. S3CR25-11]